MSILSLPFLWLCRVCDIAVAAEQFIINLKRSTTSGRLCDRQVLVRHYLRIRVHARGAIELGIFALVTRHQLLSHLSSCCCWEEACRSRHSNAAAGAFKSAKHSRLKHKSATSCDMHEKHLSTINSKTGAPLVFAVAVVGVELSWASSRRSHTANSSA